MKPSVGRIVHYTGFGNEQGGRCYSAMVTNVREAGSVDLAVFPPPKSIFESRQSVEAVVATDVTGGGNEPGHGQWHWPEREE